MIITRLAGGIGNQLFQYAAGRMLSQKHHVALGLDLSLLSQSFENVTPRQYALGSFNTDEHFATLEEIANVSLRGTGPAHTLKKIAVYLGARHLRREYFEKSTRFDPNFHTLGPNVYLGGYFQSEKYFSSIRGILRGEISLRAPMSGAAQKILDSIRETSSPVSVHVRRGDYRTNPAAAAFHGVLPRDYYRRAVAEVIARVPTPHFFVFSDEPDWAETILELDHPATIARGEGKSDAEDLMLSAACDHHIISNSSFAWWGAWLANTEKQVVVAPDRWFADTNVDSSDIIPGRWLRV